MMKFAMLIITLLSLLCAVGGMSVAGVPGDGKRGDPPPPDDIPPEFPESIPALHCPLVPKGNEGTVESLLFSHDGRTVIAGNRRGMLFWFDPTTGRLISSRRVLRQFLGGVRVLALSPDGRSLLCETGKNELSLLDAATGEPRLVLEQVPATGKEFAFSYSLAYAPDGTMVAAGLDTGEIVLWDAATGRRRAVLPPHIIPAKSDGSGGLAYPATVSSLAFTPDSKQLLSQGGPIRTWDVATGREVDAAGKLAQIPGFRLALSPDGQTLAVCQGFWDDHRHGMAGRIDLWDRMSGKKLAQLPTQGKPEDLAFLPDGKGLVSLEDERIVRLWDVATAKQRAAVRFDHHNRLSRLAVSPDGKRIAAAGCESAEIFGIIQLLDTDGTTLQPWKPEP